MIPPVDDLDALFKRLHLANARRVWRDLVRRAEQETWGYRDFLTLLVAEEIAHRQQTRLARLSRRARFPFLKTIDDFNFLYQTSLRLTMLGSALAPDFVTEGCSLILTGKPGRGKTHLAVAIAYRAIQNGFDAYFTTAATLIDDLSAAFREGQLAQALPTYTHPAVLVVDEVGYLTYGTDAANMLFHVVNERHRRRRAMIFTTNKSLRAWGRVLHDDDLAQAIIDRVLERGRLLRLDGPSVRTLHVNLDEAMKEESDSGDDVIRISGNQCPEFPEPTRRNGVFRPVTAGLLLAATVGVYPLLIAIRPQLFSVLALAVQLMLMNGIACGRTRLFLWMPVLFALWANLHGGSMFFGVRPSAASPLETTIQFGRCSGQLDVSRWARDDGTGHRTKGWVRDTTGLWPGRELGARGRGHHNLSEEPTARAALELLRLS